MCHFVSSLKPDPIVGYQSNHVYIIMLQLITAMEIHFKSGDVRHMYVAVWYVLQITYTQMKYKQDCMPLYITEGKKKSRLMLQ